MAAQNDVNNGKLYDIYKSYADNARDGPAYKGPIPERTLPPQDKWFDFLGFKVASRLGVPAGPLLNSMYVQKAAELGWDVVVYKTVRTSFCAGHPLPNIVLVDAPNQLSEQDKKPLMMRTSKEAVDPVHISITNSFGMPSYTWDYLEKDIPKAQSTVGKHQLMIVSIVGTPNKETNDPEDLFKDYGVCAKLAVQHGAKVLEANLSCPNVGKIGGTLYQNPQAISRIVTSIREAVGPKMPLLIKMGCFADKNLMKECIMAAAKAGVNGIAGINTLSRAIINPENGEPALGGRVTSGVCGDCIRTEALGFVKMAHEIIQSEKLGLLLVGGGGVMAPEHVDEFVKAGADFVMMATGFMWDPLLASKYHKTHAAKL